MIPPFFSLFFCSAFFLLLFFSFLLVPVPLYFVFVVVVVVCCPIVLLWRDTGDVAKMTDAFRVNKQPPSHQRGIHNSWVSNSSRAQPQESKTDNTRGHEDQELTRLETHKKINNYCFSLKLGKLKSLVPMCIYT